MGILSLIGLVVVVFWVLGMGFSIGGSLIHVLLVIAVIVFIYDVITRRRIK